MITSIPDASGLRDCFRDPIPEIFAAARLLDQAVTAHLEGRAADARDALYQADIAQIGEWLDSIWMNLGKHPCHQVRKVDGLPPILPKAERARPRHPGTAMKRALVARDGWHCRLCGIPLVRAEVRRALTAAYPRAARWDGRFETQQHRGLQVMWLQYDHVVVHSRGGETSLNNLVVTCPACNFGRDRFMMSEVRLRDPRDFPRHPTWDGAVAWDGLERMLPERERFAGPTPQLGQENPSVQA